MRIETRTGNPVYIDYCNMSSTPGNIRHRGGKKTEKHANGSIQSATDDLQVIVEETKATEALRSEWDFKLALGIITGIALILRFYGITHPDQVVFDEVHFGKVCSRLNG